MVLGSLSKVICAVSGGVDSAVAALLLKQKGYNVTGVFMRNWDVLDELGHCSSDEDCEYATKVCQVLDIPFHEVNLVKEYWNNVFMPTIEEYQNGCTPNPDILCNHYVKFDALHKKCDRFSENGKVVIATGHYARTTLGDNVLIKGHNYTNSDQHLLRSMDEQKDQTFFLHQITSSALLHTYFPLGHMRKNQVKEIAKNSPISFTLERKESMGICFIGKRDFSHFIKDYLPAKPGKFICHDTDKVVGHHDGFFAYTVGQRSRLSGFAISYVVLHRDAATGDVFVVPGTNHPALFSRSMICNPPHWIAGMPPSWKEGEPFHCQFRFMHQRPLVNCTVYGLPDSKKLLVVLDHPERALTVGQHSVFYLNDECLGGARIDDVGPTIDECKSRDDIKFAHFRKNSEMWRKLIEDHEEVTKFFHQGKNNFQNHSNHIVIGS